MVIEKVEKVFKSMIIEEELRNKIIEYLKSSAQNERTYRNQRISQLNGEYTKISNRIDKLTDIYLDDKISQDEYDRKREEFMEQRVKVLSGLENLNAMDDTFAEDMQALMELASGAYKAFKSSNFEQKRKLINFVFSNLFLKGEKLNLMLRPPFNELVKIPKSGEWCR